MSNYSSMDGVLYCKPHFEQLFKESGNFSKNFQTGDHTTDLITIIIFSSQKKKIYICLINLIMAELLFPELAAKPDKENPVVSFYPKPNFKQLQLETHFT